MRWFALLAALLGGGTGSTLVSMLQTLDVGLHAHPLRQHNRIMMLHASNIIESSMSVKN